MDGRQPQVAMTTEELTRTMRMLEPMYDLVRVVDPSVTQGCSLNDDGELDLPHQCFDLLAKGRRCRNCISARTVACHHSVSKFEFVGDDAFYITTRYVEVDGKPRSLELVKQINEETLVAPDDEPVTRELRHIMEDDADHRYRDDATGALNQHYLEDGIDSLRGSRVAMLRAIGLRRNGASGPGKGRDLVLSAIANSVMHSIHKVDTLVHLENDTFVIIFEGIPHRIFPTRLQQIRDHVLQALVRDAHLEGADVAIGAIEQEGALGDLVVLAQDALDKATTGSQRIVMLGKEEDLPQESPQLAAPPAPGHHERTVDALTGLSIPKAFRAMLQGRIDRMTNQSNPIVVVHLDIENFKAFNRVYGLTEGDVLLVELADAIRNAFPDDIATRVGVDTYCLATRADDVPTRLAQLRQLLSKLRRDVALELKAGLFEVKDASVSAHAAMDRAKIACDSIKGKFDLSVRSFDSELEHTVTLRDYIVESLDTAIENNYIQPYYQAIVRSFTGNACAMEALSRWVDPTYGLISPADVIPTLESRHLIHLHDVHIVRRVCADLRKKLDAGEPVVPASVNLSRLDFQLCDIFDEVESAVRELDIPRSLLGIEVTESTLDTSDSHFRPQVERFRKAGYEIWMDDFGSGYSSLNLLKDYEFDVLKIDMAFLHGLEENQNSKEIISSVVDMAKRIGIRTLAEGVETTAQFHFLRNIGCEMIQGYLFSKPTPLQSMDLTSRLGVERPADRDYLESVGRVNLLSQEPTEAVRPAESDSEVRGMPLAIVEWDGKTYHYFTANEAYLRYLRSLGFHDAEGAEAAFNANPSMLRGFATAAQQAEKAGAEQVVHYETKDASRTAAVQFVARGDHAVALLIRPQL